MCPLTDSGSCCCLVNQCLKDEDKEKGEKNDEQQKSDWHMAIRVKVWHERHL